VTQLGATTSRIAAASLCWNAALNRLTTYALTLLVSLMIVLHVCCGLSMDGEHLDNLSLRPDSFAAGELADHAANGPPSAASGLHVGDLRS